MLETSARGRIIINQTSFRMEKSLRIENIEEYKLLQKLEEKLITVFNVKKLMDILAENLPLIGIKSAFLSLYEERSYPFEWSKLIMAYNNLKRIKLPENGIRFPSKQLIPEELNIKKSFENFRSLFYDKII
jgi:hypothetical protein